MVDEGVNIDEYVFDGSKVAPKPQRPAKANGDGIQSSKEDDDEESGVDNGGTTETKKVEIAVASNGDPIFRADESETDQTAGSDKLLDNSNVDNEDSLNLTIGEDDAKIFQDEVSDNGVVLLLLVICNKQITIIFQLLAKFYRFSNLLMFFD